MIKYSDDVNSIIDDQLIGFFVGWPNPPAPKRHLDLLKGSYKVILAIDDTTNQVVGFITAISDGVISAYIPLLEVLPKYQDKGIGKALVERMLEELRHLYMVDLLCDSELQEYYGKFNMQKATGMLIRNYSRQSSKN